MQAISSSTMYQNQIYTNSTTSAAKVEEQELEAVQIAEEIVEEEEEESTSKASAAADVSLLYEVQKNASASVNLTQSVSTEGETASAPAGQASESGSSSEASDEETTTTEMVYNADGSVEQVTITTDEDGNETEERVQISGPVEEQQQEQ